MTAEQNGDSGFTLIETLMAVVIMSTAVVVLVSALAEVINQSQFHRGHAVAEAVTRNYNQAVQARVNYSSPLSAGISTLATTTTVVVQDGSGFAPSGYVNVDRETMRVTSRSGNTLSVLRGAAMNADDASVTTHSVGASVVPIYRCPGPAQFQPDTASYPRPTGVNVTINKIEYWNAVAAPAGFQDTSSPGCGSAYDAQCTYTDSNGVPGKPDVRDQCDPGLYRLSVTTTTTGSAGLKDIDTSTHVLVRRGSS
jgi:prepilin-type N-terminal cleavage/methylation domain-containing protein